MKTRLSDEQKYDDVRSSLNWYEKWKKNQTNLSMIKTSESLFLTSWKRPMYKASIVNLNGYDGCYHISIQIALAL